MSTESHGQGDQPKPRFGLESDEEAAARNSIRESRQRIDEDLEALSQRLREARRDMRRTTTAVMDIAGLPLRTVRRYPALVVAIAVALGLIIGVRRVRSARSIERRIRVMDRILGNGRPRRWVLLGTTTSKRF